MSKPFELVGIRPQAEQTPAPKIRRRPPVIALLVLGLLAAACLAAPLIAPGDAGYLDLLNTSRAPCAQFPFGTDSLGRDLFRCIWHGGRVSLFIGFFAAAISTAIAVVYGAVSGVSAPAVDGVLMRLTEILLSVPELLVVLFLQAIWGKATPVSIAVIIGVTGWYSIAKVVRTEVRQLRTSEYVVASQAMGGSFGHILRQHLAPNFISSIMFMVVMNVRSAIVAESTLSFLGMGLSVDTVSWGSMLSLSERALMTGSWWIILIPGAFLVALLLALTDVGNWLRKTASRRESNL